MNAVIKSLLATAKAKVNEGTRSVVGALSKARGLDCLTRDQSIQLCADRGLAYHSGGLTTFTRGREANHLEVLKCGVVRVDKKFCLYTNFGNRAALANIRPPTQHVPHAIALWSHKWLGFYHFLAELCPKICALQESLGADFGGAKLCYPMIHRRYEKELLGLLGVPAEALVDTNACGGVVADKLTFVPMDGWFGIPPNIPLLRRRLMPPAQSKGAELLYLRRFGQRQCLQEPAFVPELEARGFTMIDESSRSIVEQIHLFRDAKIIVGPHGSAFTNMIWAEPGARVLEMVPSTFDVPYHASLSKACGHQYTKLPCPNGPTAQSGVSIHFNVDPARFFAALDSVLKDSK